MKESYLDSFAIGRGYVESSFLRNLLRQNLVNEPGSQGRTSDTSLSDIVTYGLLEYQTSLFNGSMRSFIKVFDAEGRSVKHELTGSWHEAALRVKGYYETVN